MPNSTTSPSGPPRQECCEARKRRCTGLPRVSPDEAERLVVQFLAKGGGITRCPPAYAAPISGATASLAALLL